MCSSFLTALVSLEEKTGVHTHTHTRRDFVLQSSEVEATAVSTINASLKQIIKKTSIGGYLGLYSTTTQEG